MIGRLYENGNREWESVQERKFLYDAWCIDFNPFRSLCRSIHKNNDRGALSDKTRD
jgi:hypothetical protein